MMLATLGRRVTKAVLRHRHSIGISLLPGLHQCCGDRSVAPPSQRFTSASTPLYPPRLARHTTARHTAAHAWSLTTIYAAVPGCDMRVRRLGTTTARPVLLLGNEALRSACVPCSEADPSALKVVLLPLLVDPRRNLIPHIPPC
jgi:hypothetical protein